MLSRKLLRFLPIPVPFGNTIALANPGAVPASDFFGGAISISTAYVVVGASGDAEDGLSSGRAYIFERSTGDLLWTLDNPGATPEEGYFGWSVAASNSYVAVGAWGDSTDGLQSGRVYIYNPSTGALLWTLTNPGAVPAGGQFGGAVAISDSYLIVGATRDGTDGASSGRVYIYNPSTGALLWTLTNPGAAPAGDRFGFSVGISDSFAVVGAYADLTDGTNSGRAYIYNPSTGALLWTLTNPGVAPADDFFGDDVAASTSYVIVGAYGESVDGLNSGRAYVYDASTGGLLWTLTNPATAPIGTLFGSGVSIGDSYLVVGAEVDNTDGTDSGIAYIYDPSTGDLLWTLTNPGDAPDFDLFGSSVAISGSSVAIGAKKNAESGSSSGKAYIFT